MIKEGNIMNSILKELNDKISSNPYFLDTEGKLLREKVKSAVLNLDDELLKILLEDECLRKAFFKEENNYLIFDKAKFSWVISSKDFLPDSFTSFKNKIGLVDENNNIASMTDDYFIDLYTHLFPEGKLKITYKGYFD